MPRNVSTVAGTLGKALEDNADRLRGLKSKSDIYELLYSIKDGLDPATQNYIQDEVIHQVDRLGFSLAYQYLYRIYLAGFSDLKLGGKFRRTH